jgi:hypothetical protein
LQQQRYQQSTTIHSDDEDEEDTVVINSIYEDACDNILGISNLCIILIVFINY